MGPTGPPMSEAQRPISNHSAFALRSSKIDDFHVI